LNLILISILNAVETISTLLIYVSTKLILI